MGKPNRPPPDPPDVLNRLADLRRACNAVASGLLDPPIPKLPTRQIEVWVEAVRPRQRVPDGAIGVEHADACPRWSGQLCTCKPVVRAA